MKRILEFGCKWLMLLLFLFYATNAMAQQQVTGIVTASSSGNPMVGVNILVIGTSTGTVTDANGHYSLSVSSLQDTLRFSYIGYKTKTVSISGRTTIDVALEPTILSGQQLVVVGFGKQKKVNLTGSVGEVSGENLPTTSVLNPSVALSGQLSGVRVRQTSGNPMNNSAIITIRGQGTFSAAGNSPLVLVDGIETPIDMVNPNVIKSMTVLKDAASAAIYGSKAANGVILITTKKGSAGKMNITYSSRFAKLTPTFVPNMVPSWQYAIAANEAAVNLGGGPTYTKQEIQKFRTGSDPISYPNFKHMHHLFNSGRGFGTKQNITVSGGRDNTTYLFSGSYSNQLAIIKDNSGSSYHIRLNLNTKLSDNINFSFKTFGTRFHGKEPISAFSPSLKSLVVGALRLSNAIPGKTPNGFYGRNQVHHPEADLDSKSFLARDHSYYYGNAKLTWDITNSLEISGRAGYNLQYTQQKWFRAKYPVTKTYIITPNELSQSFTRSHQLVLRSVIQYDKTLKDRHNFHVLAGFSSHRNRVNN